MSVINIGEASEKTGVSAKMIRHYEDIGLLPKSKRTESGYRFYKEDDLHNLIFIKRARALGFSTAQIKKLMGLWLNKSRKSADVKKITQDHIEELEVKLKEMQQMIKALKEMSGCCHGDQKAECPILENLSKT